MLLFKIIGKIFAVPAITAVTILKWLSAFCGSMTGWIFRILAIITFLTAIVTYLMQISTGGETLRMLIGAFIVFMLPMALAALVAVFEHWQSILGQFLRS